MRSKIILQSAENRVTRVTWSRGVEDGCAGWAIVHPDFGRSVNPVLINCAPHIIICPSRFR